MTKHLDAWTKAQAIEESRGVRALARQRSDSPDPEQRRRQGVFGALKGAAKDLCEAKRFIINPITFEVSQEPKLKHLRREHRRARKVKSSPGLVFLDGVDASPVPSQTKRHNLHRLFKRRAKDDFGEVAPSSVFRPMVRHALQRVSKPRPRDNRMRMLGGSRMQDASRNFL